METIQLYFKDGVTKFMVRFLSGAVPINNLTDAAVDFQISTGGGMFETFSFGVDPADYGTASISYKVSNEGGWHLATIPIGYFSGKDVQEPIILQLYNSISGPHMDTSSFTAYLSDSARMSLYYNTYATMFPQVIQEVKSGTPFVITMPVLSISGEAEGGVGSLMSGLSESEIAVTISHSDASLDVVDMSGTGCSFVESLVVSGVYTLTLPSTVADSTDNGISVVLTAMSGNDVIGVGRGVYIPITDWDKDDIGEGIEGIESTLGDMEESLENLQDTIEGVGSVVVDVWGATTGEFKIENNQLSLYKPEEETPFIIFDLKDEDGEATNTYPYSRVINTYVIPDVFTPEEDEDED